MKNIMKYINKTQLLVLLYLSIFNHKSCAKAIPTTQDIDFKSKHLMTETDLFQNYETLSRNAVTRDTIVSDVRSQKDKYVSINNGMDFNIPIDDNIMSRPIGTYQYIDSEGDLHIVDFINGPNGLRILNDYKPYSSPESRNKLKNLIPKDPKTNFKGIQRTEENDSSDQISDKDINYDEFEFTFMPHESNNKSFHKNINKINALNSNSDQSNRKIDRLSSNKEPNKWVQNDNNYERIDRLTRLLHSIPLPQPFSVPNQSQPPFQMQIPDPTNDNWRGVPPIYQRTGYGMSSQGPAVSFSSEPLFNWNPKY